MRKLNTHKLNQQRFTEAEILPTAVSKKTSYFIIKFNLGIKFRRLKTKYSTWQKHNRERNKQNKNHRHTKPTHQELHDKQREVWSPHSYLEGCTVPVLIRWLPFEGTDSSSLLFFSFSFPHAHSPCSGHMTQLLPLLVLQHCTVSMLSSISVLSRACSWTCSHFRKINARAT